MALPATMMVATSLQGNGDMEFAVAERPKELLPRQLRNTPIAMQDIADSMICRPKKI